MTTKYLAKFQSPRAITRPKIIGSEWNVNLICNSSLYTHISKIKSISPSIAKSRDFPEPVIAHLAQIGCVVLENSIIYQRMGGWTDAKLWQQLMGVSLHRCFSMESYVCFGPMGLWPQDFIDTILNPHDLSVFYTKYCSIDCSEEDF